MDRNREDCNADLIPHRKAARESYRRNKQHKAKHRSQYYLCNLLFEYDENNKALTAFNFKKTTGRKYRYSCGGYGGRCPMCSNGYQKDGKNMRKVDVLGGVSSKSIYLKSSVLAL